MVWDAKEPLSVPNHPLLSRDGTLSSREGTLRAGDGTLSGWASGEVSESAKSARGSLHDVVFVCAVFVGIRVHMCCSCVPR